MTVWVLSLMCIVYQFGPVNCKGESVNEFYDLWVRKCILSSVPILIVVGSCWMTWTCYLAWFLSRLYKWTLDDGPIDAVAYLKEMKIERILFEMLKIYPQLNNDIGGIIMDFLFDENEDI